MKTEIKLGLGNRFKAQVIENGRVVRETAWKKNLILNQGLDAVATHLICDLFLFCAIGTGVSTPINTQTGLDVEVVRSNTYVTGAPNCTSALAANVLTHTRTFDFPLEVTGITYSEVGWSHTGTVASNLNTRGLFASPVSVGSGQSLRVVYQFIVTITPNTQRALTAPITGWPSRQWNVGCVCNGTGGTSFPGVLSQPSIGGGDTVDYFATNEPVTIIAQGGSGLTNGQTYYVGGLLTSQFEITTTQGSGINLHFPGSGSFTVTIVSNATGNEQRILVGLSAVNTDGTTKTGGFDSAGVCGEPSVDSNYVGLSPYTGAIPSFNTPIPSGISANAFAKVYAVQTYTTGNYFRDKQVQFVPADGGSNRDDWLWLLLMPTSSAFTTPAYAFKFKHRQQKLNTATLTVVMRASWTRS
jgi:hypothetical protein